MNPLEKHVLSVFNESAKPLWLVAIGRRKVLQGHYWDWSLWLWPVWIPKRFEDWAWEDYEVCRLRAHTDIEGERVVIVPDDGKAFTGNGIESVYAVSIRNGANAELYKGDLALSSKNILPNSSIAPKIILEFGS